MQEFGITSFLREAAFLAQLAHESGELRFMEEIASGAAYEGRRDLGNTQPGDGRRYKGRGPIQLTGRANYKLFGDLLGLDLINNPTMAATPQVGFRIAGLFWKRRGLNELADQQDFRTITKRINGGFNGLPDRIKFYERAKNVLSRDDSGDVAPPPPMAPVETSVGGAGAPPYPGTPLRQGSIGAAVRNLQQRLKDLGYSITADGDFGPGTRQRVIDFQRTNGVMGDGIVGPNTWRLLFGPTAKRMVARKSAKKAAKKSAKKAVKKAAKKPARKTARKAAQKTAGKPARKAAQRPAKKAAGKSAKKSATRGAAKKRGSKASRKARSK